ncbi:MAG TPA: cytochrome c oxidase subunit I, partial [Myxococcaceae bacterium]|nr:cytochrome c oxidase subunit I [Myxococcaceae bacterium]
MNPSERVEPVFPEHHYLNAGTTVRSWLLTRDHKRIGVMFLVAVILALLLGGTFALLLRFEHLTPGPTYVSAVT